MISIYLNNEPMDIIREASGQAGRDVRPETPWVFAIAVNENFVPRSSYQQTSLSEGDRVEVLVPSQGG